MDDLATAPLSTAIDAEPAPSPTGGGQMSLSEPDQPKTLREDIEAAFKEADKPESKDDKKPTEDQKVETPVKEQPKEEAPKDEPKDAAKPIEEPEAADAEKAEPAKEAKPEEKPEGTFKEPPKRFLADSREAWRNVPRAVRRDIEAWQAEHEQDQQRYQEVSQRYDRVRDFDELARSNGRDLRESLMQVHQFENMMRQNPVAALNMALMQVGPRKADGQPVSLFEIAQHIVQQGPEGYQQMMARSQQPQQPQEDPRVTQLETELQQMKVQQLAQQVIEPFRAKHPRYDELQDDIALLLQSGKIPQTLSLPDRLAAAYDLAERMNPPSRASQSTATLVADPDPDRRADLDFSGSKSIKSSPGSITETVDDQAKGGESIRDSILAAARRVKR